MSNRIRGLIVIGESLLIFAPQVILGSAIDWPASLDDPAAIALPRMLDNEGAVRFGYLVYLFYSVMFLPVAVMITRWVHRTDRIHPVVQIAVGLAAASAALRSIGIIRWLSTMFPLAEQWETADEPTRQIIALQFEALNDFGGSIGETLGVTLFAAAWLAVTTLGRSGTRHPRWIMASGGVAALLLASPLIELTGVEIEPLNLLGGIAITTWLFVAGVAMFRSADDNAPAVSAQ